MGIAARWQILRSNSSLITLKLTDNCMGPHGLLALSDALAASRPPLEEVYVGNLGISSGDEICAFVRVLRRNGSPLRVLDLHGNPLAASAEPADEAGVSAAPSAAAGPLRALAELSEWMSSESNCLRSLNLRECMRDDAAAELHEAAIRLLCAGLASPHCALTELNVHGFGFKPPTVKMLADSLRDGPDSYTF